MVAEVCVVGVVLYVKRVFGPWESINPSRQFLRFIGGNLPY
jgi:hypothetical protein